MRFHFAQSPDDPISRWSFWAAITLLAAGVLFSESTPAPTFYRDVLPVLQAHCQRCHRAGEIAPMPLVTYQEVRFKATVIRNRIQRKIMPPWFADPCCGHFARYREWAVTATMRQSGPWRTVSHSAEGGGSGVPSQILVLQKIGRRRRGEKL